MKRVKVLLAEDDPVYREIILACLRGFNGPSMDTVVVETGQSALDLLLEGRFDLAVTDYHLPDGTADEIIFRLRDRQISMPVIIITADDSAATERRARSASPVFYFVKPFGADDFRSVVNAVLTSSGRLITPTQTMQRAGKGVAV